MRPAWTGEMVIVDLHDAVIDEKMAGAGGERWQREISGTLESWDEDGLVLDSDVNEQVWVPAAGIRAVWRMRPSRSNG